MMIVSNLLSTFGLTRRELHGREMGIPFIWMWCHWAVMTNNPLFKFKRNISQLIFGIFGWYIKCVIMMKLSIIRNNGEKVTYCWRGLLSASWFFTFANHCQVVSGAYHAQWTLVNGHVRIYQGWMDYFSIAGVKIGTKKYEISSPHPTQLLPERDHALLLRPFQPGQIKNIRIDGFKYSWAPH